MLNDLREGIAVIPIEAGHCPHDEVPNEVAEAMKSWMRLQFVGKRRRASNLRQA
jgi:hypothetical protein